MQMSWCCIVCLPQLQGVTLWWLFMCQIWVFGFDPSSPSDATRQAGLGRGGDRTPEGYASSSLDSASQFVIFCDTNHCALSRIIHLPHEKATRYFNGLWQNGVSIRFMFDNLISLSSRLTFITVSTLNWLHDVCCVTCCNADEVRIKLAFYVLQCVALSNHWEAPFVTTAVYSLLWFGHKKLCKILNTCKILNVLSPCK